MLKEMIKKLLIAVLKCLPFDGVLRASQSLSSGIASFVFSRDWGAGACDRPQFFKHRINLGRWAVDPSQWSFAARGVFAREVMFKGCKVLDLCCGDGFYSYFFFLDIAGKIDAVDNDNMALSYAKRYHAAPVIEYHKINIVEQPLPVGPYDIVVWNAAICYFTEPQIRNILKEIIRVGKKEMVLCGMAPKASGYFDHKTEFKESDALKKLLQEFFSSVTMREVEEVAPVFYFRAQGALTGRAGL